MEEVAVVYGESRFPLTENEAGKLLDRFVERSIPSKQLHAEMRQALKRDVVLHDDPMRSELVLCLQAIADDEMLTEGLQRLLDGVREPV